MGETSAAFIYERLTRMEGELADLRRSLLKIYGADLAQKRPGSLRGIWKGVAIGEEDFAEAKASLFPERDV